MRKVIPAIFAFVVLCPCLLAQQGLDNDGVIKLVKAGLSESLIIDTINASPANYDTSANGLVALKQAGASDKVIDAIVRKASGTAPVKSTRSTSPAVASGLPSGIDEVGVYYKNGQGTWTALTPEIASIAMRGLGLLTSGLVGRGSNGRIKGPTAAVSLSLPSVIAVYIPDDTSISEYTLFRLRSYKNEMREFRIVNGGVSPDGVSFKAEKIAPRVYTIRLQPDLGKGEYGLLPPSSFGGLKSEEIHTSGKIYCISISGVSKPEH